MNYKPLRPEIIMWEDLTSQPLFAVKSYKDSVYRGEIEDSMRHGRGVITYNSSRIYEGHWVRDKREGLGFERFSNANTDEGEYFKGKVHG